MRPIKEIKSVKKVVIELLTEHPHLREDDNKLIANIWYKQVNYKEFYSYISFLKHLANGDLISTESICRCRRKVQQDNPHLRGKNYNLRLEESEIVRQEIKTI